MRGLTMGKKEQVASVLQLVGGNAEQAEKIVDEVDRFFNNLNAEVEDWKISMEEFKDGTRIFARVQVLVKK
jgi:DNA polymerase elongation subunit (family B)